MDGQRKALIVANDEYDSAALSRLKAPAADARALAHVLGDRDIGGFQVDVVLNEPAHDVELRIEDLFADSQSDDILLLHFSCHGLKSEAGELFFAARNTRPDRLGATAIPADFIQRCIKTCRARSVVLFLDCCYGGAYGQGVAVRASGSANVLESFPTGKLGGGRGRAVITASSSMEYAFEGNELADDHQQQPSLFTSALVEGLESGDADRDEDGLVSLNELYEFVFDRVREQNPNQTPSRDVEMQGELYVAKSKRKRLRPVPIPAEVQAALVDPNMFTRLGAVSELRARLNSNDLPAALGAHAALVELSRTDIKYVGDAAGEALAGATLSVVEPALDFGRVERDADPGPLTLHLQGPPIARSATLSSRESWIRIDRSPEGHQVTVDSSVAGRLHGSITVTGPLGEANIPVLLDVVQAAEVAGVAEVGEVAEVAEIPAEVAATAPQPVEVNVEPGEVKVEPVEVKAEPVEADPNPRARTPDWKPETEAVDPVTPLPVATKPPPQAPPQSPSVAPPAVPVASGSPKPDEPAYGTGKPDELAAGMSRLRWSGWIAVAGGALMLLGLFLPFRYDISLLEKGPWFFWYELLLCGLALVAGALALVSRPGRWFGPGLILGCAATAVWGLVVLLLPTDEEGFNFGVRVQMLAHLTLVVAGVVAAVALSRLAGVSIRGLSAGDGVEWLVGVIGVVSAVVMLVECIAGWQNSTWYGVTAAVFTGLALVVPVAALLVRPRRLGIGILTGWLVGALAITIWYWTYLYDYTGGDTPKIDAFAVTLGLLALTTGAWAVARTPGRQHTTS